MQWTPEEINKVLAATTGVLSVLIGPILTKLIKITRSSSRREREYAEESQKWADRCTQMVERMTHASETQRRAVESLLSECGIPPLADEPGESGGSEDAPYDGPS